MEVCFQRTNLCGPTGRREPTVRSAHYGSFPDFQMKAEVPNLRNPGDVSIHDRTTKPSISPRDDGMDLQLN